MKNQIPNFNIPFINPDKLFQEEATDDIFDIPHSSRVIFYGGPQKENKSYFKLYLIKTVVHND